MKEGSSTTATYTHTKDEVGGSVGDIVTYTIEVFNEGEVSGYASLIKDDIPEGIEFVICKQDYPKIITNYAQISEDTDESEDDVRDRISTPNEWKGEDDEDIENLRVTYIDLALRKFITAVNWEAVTSRIPNR